MEETMFDNLPSIPTHPELNGAKDHIDEKTGKRYLDIKDEKIDLNLNGNSDGNVVRVIKLNRPHLRNPFNDWMYLAVADAMNDARDDDNVIVVVLTGEGEYFSSGADIGSDPNGAALKLGNGNANDPVGIFMLTLMRFPKLLIAALNGPAVGVGTTLIPHCDVTFAADNVYLWTPFARIAVVPEFCSSVLFPQIMGKSVANEMLLLSRKMDIEKAKRVGFVTDVFPAGPNFLPRVLDEIRTGLNYPLIDKSLPMFKSMISRWDMQMLHEVFYLEMKRLDERGNNGDIIHAIMEFQKKKKQAKKDRQAKSSVQTARL